MVQSPVILISVVRVRSDTLFGLKAILFRTLISCFILREDILLNDVLK